MFLSIHGVVIWLGYQIMLWKGEVFAMQCAFLNAEHLSSSGICHKKNFSGDLQSSFGSLTNLTWLWVFLVLDWCLSSKLNVIQDFIFKCICRYLQNNKITRYIRASRWASTDFPVGDPHCFLLQLMLYVPLIPKMYTFYSMVLPASEVPFVDT